MDSDWSAEMTLEARDQGRTRDVSSATGVSDIAMSTASHAPWSGSSSGSSPRQPQHPVALRLQPRLTVLLRPDLSVLAIVAVPVQLHHEPRGEAREIDDVPSGRFASTSTAGGEGNTQPHRW